MQAFPQLSCVGHARPTGFVSPPFTVAGLFLAGIVACGAATIGCARVNGGNPPGPGLGDGQVLQGVDAGAKFTADGSPGDVVACDGGDACMCPPFKLAVIGKPGKWGAYLGGDPDTALQDWLNSSSAGTAQGDHFTQRTTLTADFLARFNVIILASLADDSNDGPWWTITTNKKTTNSTKEQNNRKKKTQTNNTSNGAEIAPVNQLIQFS